MNEQLKIMMDFKGYGNPKGKYWFIGIEEALAIDNDEKLKPYISGVLHNNKGDYTKYKEEFYENLRNEGKSGRYTSTYDIVGKIIRSVEDIDEDLTEFLNKNLFTESGNNFYTNIFPLGKPNAKDSLQKRSLDFMGLQDMKEYFEIVRNYRYKNLYNFWNESNQAVTICFGKRNWDDFENLLNKDKSQRQEIIKDKIYLHSGSNIYLVPFFVNYSMNGNLIDILTTDIRNRIIK